MESITALLLSCVLFAPNTDPDSELVITQIRDHFSRISSVHVRGIVRFPSSGGLWANDPESEPLGYNDKRTSEFDLWLDPPKQKQAWVERNTTGIITSSVSECFDGKKYTYLNPAGKMGLVREGSSMVKPPRTGPLHALGFCFMETYHTSLGSLLEDRAHLTVEKVAPAKQGAEWVITVRALPSEVRPQDWSEKARKRTVVRIWVTIDPQLRITKWAVYSPKAGAAHDEAMFRHDVPSMRFEGYNVCLAFINIYGPQVNRENAGSPSPVVRRILCGNGNAMEEMTVNECSFNSAIASKVFRADIPPGYSISKPEKGSDKIVITGGSTGEALKVHDISQEARQLVGDGDKTSALLPGLGDWIVPCMSAALIGVGVALAVFFWRKNR